MQDALSVFLFVRCVPDLHSVRAPDRSRARVLLPLTDEDEARVWLFSMHCLLHYDASFTPLSLVASAPAQQPRAKMACYAAALTTPSLYIFCSF